MSEFEFPKNSVYKIRQEILKHESLFSDKKFLDSLYLPSEIMGRDKQTRQLVTYLMDTRNNFLVPTVSIYGKSGSGKSTIVKHVCKHMSDILCWSFVNLRKSKTAFGCATLILEELGGKNLVSADGMNKAMHLIEKQIEYILDIEQKKFFVLVLDEFDVIFNDTRMSPSDFMYGLVQIEENLREKNIWLCIFTISNNGLQEFSLDDRIKSRIGNSSVFFPPYQKNDILELLKTRSAKAFRISISDEILDKCADMCCEDHGDARRALDLLRVAGERCNGEITKDDLFWAKHQIDDDHIRDIVINLSYHSGKVLEAVCVLSLYKNWTDTSDVFYEYTKSVDFLKQLSYRRVSDMLVELENSGLLVSKKSHRGHAGYGKSYRLVESPDFVGNAIHSHWWEDKVLDRRLCDDSLEYMEKFGYRFTKQFVSSLS